MVGPQAPKRRVSLSTKGATRCNWFEADNHFLLRDAWHAHHSLSRTEAKRRYISTLIETMHKYATTTPEARELVAELEFVWDQIKSNTASSSSSSPGQLTRSHQQMMKPSYASLGQSGKGKDEREGGGGGVGLRVLRPVSDGDEGEDEEGEEYEEARHAPFDEDKGAVAGATQGRDLDARNRKWRKRIEQALVKLTTEVAALREQVEAKRIGEGKRRNGMWAWMCWLVWIAVRHLVVDLALLGLLLVWARRKGDRRVEQGLELLLGYVRERVRKARVPGVLRGPAQQA